MINRTLPLVLVTLFLLGAYGCDPAKDDGAAARKEEESRAKKANFAAKHNAVVDWLDPKAGGFTLEFQNALIRQDGRPVLEDVFLEDVRQDAEGLVAQFMSYRDSECRWQLSCKPEQAQALMKSGSYESYLIIVRVSSVKRGLIPQSREYSDGTTGVEDDSVIQIRGQLVDCLKE